MDGWMKLFFLRVAAAGGHFGDEYAIHTHARTHKHTTGPLGLGPGPGGGGAAPLQVC